MILLAFPFAASLAMSTGAMPVATRVDVVSQVSGDMEPGTSRCEPPGEFYCTISNAYTVTLPPDFGRAFAGALLLSVPAPTPKLFGLNCPQTPRVDHSLEAGSELEHLPGGKNKVSLKVYLDSGQTIVAQSASEVEYGVPWAIQINAQSHKTYNPEIGRMTSAFLYRDDRNRPVLDGSAEWARITEDWCYNWQQS